LAKAVTIKPSIAQLRADTERLLRDAVPLAYTRGLNKVANRTRTEAKRVVATESRVPVRALEKRMRVKPGATVAKPRAVLGSLVAPLDLKEIGTPVVRPKLRSVVVGRGATRHAFPMAFIAPVQGGRATVAFKRHRRSGGVGFTEPHGVELVPRYPISEVTVSLVEPEVRIPDKAYEITGSEFMPEFDRQLALEATKRGFKS